MCDVEAQGMRRVLSMMAMAVMLAVGARMAEAQMVDPSTGMMVDPATDPMDFAALVSGQPTNPAQEAGMNALAQMNAMQQAQQAAQQQQDFQNFMNSSSASASSTAAAGVVAMTPKPKIAPKGGTFKGSVEVSMSEADASAMVHYTTDGSKPTLASPLYVEPFTVSAKTKVSAVAMDGSARPSSVVTAKFTIKS
jgi:hypothetical protein